MSMRLPLRVWGSHYEYEAPITSMRLPFRVWSPHYEYEAPITSMRFPLRVWGSHYEYEAPITSMRLPLRVWGSHYEYEAPITSMGLLIQVAQNNQRTSLPMRWSIETDSLVMLGAIDHNWWNKRMLVTQRRHRRKTYLTFSRLCCNSHRLLGCKIQSWTLLRPFDEQWLTFRCLSVLWLRSF